MKAEEIEAVEQAMAAITLIRRHYGSSAEGFVLVKDILSILRNGTSLFRANMADAILASLNNKEVEIIQRRAGTKLVA